MPHDIALIHKEAGSDYGMSFPHLHGCISAGEGLEEARAMVEEALALPLEGLAEEGIVPPVSSSLDQITSEASNREAVAILVSAPAQTAKSVRVNITLPEDVLAAIDAHAQQHGFTRSWLLARAAREAIAGSRSRKAA